MSALRFALLASALLAASALAAPPPAPLPLTQAGDLVATALANCTFTGLRHAGWEMCWRLDEGRAQGLELYAVTYRGTQVFFEVGFPFSITKYHNNFFGPYKDALGTPRLQSNGYGNGAIDVEETACPRFLSEGEIDITGKVCVEHADGPNPRLTVWSRFDIYNYRMVQGYHFHADGTFQPFVMLGGTLVDAEYAPCRGAGGSACVPHFHHLYWRFDADVGGPHEDRVQEFRYGDRWETGQRNRTAPACPSTAVSWCTVATESGLIRNLSASTKWRVVDFTQLNGKGVPRSIELLSGSQSPADAVSTRDAWALRLNPGNEYGYEVSTNPYTDAAITAYANGASLDPADVVLWYAEKVYHEPRDEEKPTMMYHVAGPTLKMRNFLPSNQAEPTYP